MNENVELADEQANRPGDVVVLDVGGAAVSELVVEDDGNVVFPIVARSASDTRRESGVVELEVRLISRTSVVKADHSFSHAGEQLK